MQKNQQENSDFLSKEELIRFSGFKRQSKQIKVFKNFGVPAQLVGKRVLVPRVTAYNFFGKKEF
jgi:Domain of unknown function (DUF4224)